MTYAEIRERVEKVARAREVALLLPALTRAGWNLHKAADLLDCPVSTLHRAVSRHPILAERVGGRGRPKKAAQEGE